MPAFRPRSKRAYRKSLRGLRVSKESKTILAEIANEVEGAYCDAMNELRSAALTTLFAVRDELGVRSSTHKKVSRLIKKLQGAKK